MNSNKLPPAPLTFICKCGGERTEGVTDANPEWICPHCKRRGCYTLDLIASEPHEAARRAPSPAGVTELLREARDALDNICDCGACRLLVAAIDAALSAPPAGEPDKATPEGV